MAKYTDAIRDAIIAAFNAGDQPTEAQFTNWITRIQEGIEEHDHDGTGDGDGIASIGITGITGGGVDVPNGWYLGIGAALERIVFDAAGDITVLGGNFGVNLAAPVALFHIDKNVAGNQDVAYFFNSAMVDGNYLSTRFGKAAAINESYAFEYKYDAGGTSLLGLTHFGDNVGDGFVQRKGGFVSIGTIAGAASAILDLSSTTGALLVPRMTTAQRNALAGVDGMIIYNTSSSKIQAREAGAWLDLI